VKKIGEFLKTPLGCLFWGIFILCIPFGIVALNFGIYCIWSLIVKFWYIEIIITVVLFRLYVKTTDDFNKEPGYGGTDKNRHIYKYAFWTWFIVVGYYSLWIFIIHVMHGIIRLFNAIFDALI
jgi:hypothetical protein